MIRRLVILGATGDLTGRYLLPALARLRESGELPDGFTVTCVGLQDWDTEKYRSHARERLAHHAGNVSAGARQALVGALEYRKADVTSREEMAKVLGRSPEPVAVYLALPPRVAPGTVRALAGLGLPEESRLVLEKPFGEDLETARSLNRLLHEHFPESAVFRMDHFLGKQTVLNILGVRFANRVFELLWNRDHVERVEIVWDETVALEGRAGYYDAAGALRDMIQNHLLQLLCLAGMEPPVTLHEHDLRDRKVDVLRAVRRLSPEEVERFTVRARYTAGSIDGRQVPSYVDEPGVDPRRNTETFAQVTLFIDNWRWAGVPFILRTGKALGQDRQEIAVWFRPVPHLAFEGTAPLANVLRLRLYPDRMSLGMNINGPGDPFDLERVELETNLAPQDPSAYGRLLLDVLQGDFSLSIRFDEAEESWRIVEPILETWSAGRVPMREYLAGSNGPR